MMELPRLYPIQPGRSMVTTFGGLNETHTCAEAELSADMNFSSRGYPALETRIPRRKLRGLHGCNGLYHLNGLLLVIGTGLEYVPDDASDPKIKLENVVSDTEKTLIGIGTRVLIWPDAKSFDTATGKLTNLGAKWTQSGAVTIEPCDAGGKTYTITNYGEKEPGEPKDGDLFLKVNSKTSTWAYVNVLERWDAQVEKWVEILLNYVRIRMPGIKENFKQGDTVTIEGVPDVVKKWLAADVAGEVNMEKLEGDAVVIAATPVTESLKYYGKFTVSNGETVWTSLDGKVTERQSGGKMTAERRVPKLEYVTENANRVWGCNSEENTIYSCKQGDPTNWFVYNGIASDSYAVNVGSDGPFTGAATCMGYVLFWKESTVHKLYGSRPADYQLVSVQCRGVARGCSRSLCVLGEVLYYLSMDGVMAWDGSLPIKISNGLDGTKLANVRYAAGAALDTRYYLHLRTPSRTRMYESRLLVYDTEKGVWHEESANGFAMAGTGRQLYLWDGEALWAADPEREIDRDDPAVKGVEPAINFDCVTGDIGLSVPSDKYVSRVSLRIDAQARSVIKIQASYDGGPWQLLGETSTGDRWTHMNLPFVPARHDTMRLRISGTGQITIRSVDYTFSESRGGRISDGVPRR